MKGCIVMKKPLNYSITWNEDGEAKEILLFSHHGMIETYLSMIGSGRNISSLKVWKIFKKSEKEEYTGRLNSFIEYGK